MSTDTGIHNDYDTGTWKQIGKYHAKF